MDPSAEMGIPRGSVGHREHLARLRAAIPSDRGHDRYAKPMHALAEEVPCHRLGRRPSLLHAVVQSWAGHADYRTTTRYYLKASEGDFDRVTGLAQKPAQNPDSTPRIVLSLKRARGLNP